jgi:ABC-type uncharacterized transport system fused permease/ATPase subunit
VVEVVEAWLLFIVSGLLGGLAHGLLHARSWRDLTSFEFFRVAMLGVIGGFVFYLLHTEWNIPNGVVAFMFGYAFKDMIETLMYKFRLPKG